MRWGCKNKRTDNRRTWNLREGCENKSPKRKIFLYIKKLCRVLVTQVLRVSCWRVHVKNARRESVFCFYCRLYIKRKIST